MALQIFDFVRSQPRFSQEQLPAWHQHAKQRPCYHIFLEEDVIVAVATVLETKGRLARIQFGPLAISKEVCSHVVDRLSVHYRKLGFWNLYVQGNEIASNVNENPIKGRASVFNARSWSTIWVDLTQENLFTSFSKHHQRMIKKAEKIGLEARILKEEDLEAFNSGYCAMYKYRGHALNVSQQFQMLKNRYKILSENGLGLLYGAFDGQELIGGVMVVSQGSSWFYVQGFASVRHRHLPINHYLFHELFILAKIQGYKVFDMGGYNRFVKASDQVYRINQFKIGFSDRIVDYTPQTEFVFKPLPMLLWSAWQRLQKLISW